MTNLRKDGVTKRLPSFRLWDVGAAQVLCPWIHEDVVVVLPNLWLWSSGRRRLQCLATRKTRNLATHISIHVIQLFQISFIELVRHTFLILQTKFLEESLQLARSWLSASWDAFLVSQNFCPNSSNRHRTHWWKWRHTSPWCFNDRLRAETTTGHLQSFKVLPGCKKHLIIQVRLIKRLKVRIIQKSLILFVPWGSE